MNIHVGQLHVYSLFVSVVSINAVDTSLLLYFKTGLSRFFFVASASMWLLACFCRRFVASATSSSSRSRTLRSTSARCTDSASQWRVQPAPNAAFNRARRTLSTSKCVASSRATALTSASVRHPTGLIPTSRVSLANYRRARCSVCA